MVKTGAPIRVCSGGRRSPGAWNRRLTLQIERIFTISGCTLGGNIASTGICCCRSRVPIIWSGEHYSSETAALVSFRKG